MKNFMPSISCLLIVLIFTFLNPVKLHAQELDWWHTVNGTSVADIYRLDVDNSGNTIITGSFLGSHDFFNSGSPPYDLTSSGTDAYFAKYGPSGDSLCVVQIGGTSTDIGFDIIADSFDNIIVCGSATGQVHIGNYDSITTNSYSTDGFVGKYDPNGNWLWVYPMGSTGGDYARSVTVDGDGNVYVIGVITGPSSFDGVPGNEINSTSGSDVFLVKFHSDGIFHWVRRIYGASSEDGYGVDCDNSGNIVVTGYFYSDKLYFNVDSTVFATNHTAMADGFLGKYDTNGNALWAISMGGTSIDYSNDVKTDQSNNIYVSGEFRYSGDFDNDGSYEVSNHSGGGSPDGFLAKYDENGNPLWARGFGGTGDDAARRISIGTNGDPWIIGTCYGKMDFDQDTSVWEIDNPITTSTAYFAHFDNNGIYVEGNYFLSNAFSSGNGICHDGDNNLYLGLSFSNNMDYDFNLSYDINLPNRSGFVAKYLPLLPLLSGGTYVIGPSGDFITFSEAANALKGGITGPVIFEVESGVYNEQVTLDSIPGTSPVNTITFRSQTGNPDDVVLTWHSEAPGFTVQLDGTDYIIFESITFEAQNSTFGRAVWTTTNTISLSFTGNKFIAPYDATGYSPLWIDNADTVYVTSNEFIGGYYGFVVLQGTSYEHIIVDGNQFIDQVGSGPWIQQISPTGSVEVINNYITSTSTSYEYGLVDYDNAGGSDYQNNQVYLESGNGGWIYGMGAQKWKNNFISVFNGGSGIIIDNTFLTLLYNNSIKIGHLDLSPGSGEGIYISNSTGYFLFNNIVANYAGGYAINDQMGMYGGDYNNLFTTGNYIGTWGPDPKTTLIDWQNTTFNDYNSISIDPEFVADDDLHTYNPDLKAGVFDAQTPDKDIDGEQRDTTTPFIGADEYPLLNGLLAYYPFPENFWDYSGYGRDAVGVGITFTDDLNGDPWEAILLNSHAYIPHDFGLNVDNQSEVFWFKTDISDTEQTLITKGARTTALPGNYRVWIGSDNYLYYSYTDGASDYDLQSGETIVPGRWYHVAAVLDSFDMVLYVNNVESNSGFRGGAPVYNTDSVLIGINIDVSEQLVNQFQGTIDELLLYNRALTPDDVDQLYFDLPSPMVGEYTIGPTALDYGTINHAVMDLGSRGISGDVTFNIESGIYDEQIYMSYVDGSDSVNIVFQSDALDSSAVTIRYNSDEFDNYVLNLDEVSRTSFQYLTFMATNPDYGTVVEIMPVTRNIVFNNNQFLGIPGAVAGDERVIVRRDWYDWGHDSGILFQGNLFKDGARGIQYEESNGILVSNNIFQDQTESAIHLTDIGSPIINKNTISSTSTTYWDGIFINSTTKEDDSYGYPRIKGNKISMYANRFLAWGISVNDSYPDPATPGQIYNNFVHMEALTDSTMGVINLNGVDNMNVYHNSVNLTGSSPGYGRVMSIRDCDVIDLKNNIFNNLADGKVFNASLTVTNLTSDYNNAYTTGSVFAYYADPYNQSMANLSEWQTVTGQDNNSMTDSVEFTTDNDLHISHPSLAFGTPLVGIVDQDIDDDPRDASAPYVGADELLLLELDSMVLVNLFNSMDGPSWTNASGWLLSPIHQWYGVTVQNDRVTRLSLQGNSLSGDIPAEIAELDSLTYLDLGTNGIAGTIPPEIGNLSKLDTLGFAGNQIAGDLPVSLSNLSNLRALWLDNNQFSGTIPDEFTNLTNLLAFYASTNQFSGGFPEVLGSMSSLQGLGLTDCLFDGPVPDTLQHLINLNGLYLSNNDFTSFPDLSGITGLSYLDISGNQLTFDHIEPNVTITNFTYAPQDSVGVTETIQADLYGPFTISISTGGANNQYQWFLDDVIVDGATSASYTVSSATIDDFGDYHCQVTNTVAVALTLYSRIKTVESSGSVVGMFGTYTISPSGDGDYSTFTEAVNAVAASSVIGTITFKVFAGTFQEQVLIPALSGTSDTTQVIFEPDFANGADSTNVILEFTANTDANNYTLKMEGASYITFRNMTLKNKGPDFSRVVDITNGSYKIVLENNIIEAPFGNSDHTNNSLVWIIGSDNRRAHTLHNNYFGAGAGAITMQSAYGIMISNNVMEGQNLSGIRAFNPDSLTVSGNQIVTMSDSYIGIDIYNIQAGLLIEKNNIHIEPATVDWSQSDGIRLNNCTGSSGIELQVINNFVHTLTTGGFGISFWSCEYIQIYHNTVWIEDNNTTTSAIILDLNSSNITVKNNIFFANVGYAVYYGTSNVIVSDYNDLYTNGSNIGYLVDTDFTDLYDWRTNTSPAMDYNSVSIMPDFVAPDDLHVTSKDLDNLGTPLAQVIDDIDGEIRDSYNPDMGADEFTAVDLPDLVVTNQSVDPSSAYIGEAVALNGQIENIGSANMRSISTDLKIYLSSDTVYQASQDSLLVTYPFDTVDVDPSVSFSETFTFDDTYTPANYYILFIADQDNLATEEDEFNNLSYFAFVLVGQPDLTITNEAVSPTSATIGQAVNLSCRIENNGTASLDGDANFRVYLSTDATITEGEDALLVDTDYTGINYGSYSDFAQDLTFDGYTAGTYFLIYTIDYLSAIDESDETNNLATVSFELLSSAGIDLTISDINVSPVAATIGQSVDLMYKVKNVGDTDLGVNDTVSVYLSTDQSAADPAILIQQYVITGLLSGDSVEYSDPFTFDITFTEGDYYLVFVVDEGNTVIEANESNNLFTVAFSLSTAVGLDLNVTNAAVDPTTILIGEGVDISCDIQNLGDSVLTSTTAILRVYLSSDASINAVDSLLDEYPFESLAAGTPINYASLYTFTGYTAGTYNVIFIIDEDNAISESNENNNVTSVTLTIDQADGPDLVITNPGVSADPINIFEGFNITCNIDNIGSQDAGSFTFNAFLSTNMTLDGDEPELLSVSIPSIATSASYNLDEGVGPLTSTSPGSYYIIYYADVNGGVGELDETNNMATLAVTLDDSDVEDPIMTDATYPATFQSGDGTQSYSVTATDNVGVTQVDIIYKGIADPEADYITSTLTISTINTYSLSLEPTVFDDEVGLMFLFRAFDAAGNSDSTQLFYTYIKYGNEEAPSISDLPFGKDSLKYRIVAIPYVFPTGGNTVQAIFGDDLDSLKKSNIRMFSFGGSSYSELTASSAIQRGKGYWLLKLHDAAIDFGEANAGNNSPSNPFSINVISGWNMIGNPYPFNIDWDDVVLANPGVPLSQFTIWEGAYDDQTDGRLNRFRGAFVRADNSGNIDIPMVKYGSGGGRNGNVQDQDKFNSLTESSWKLDLDLEAGGFTNHIGGIGMNQKAYNAGDYLDKITLPRFYTYLEVQHSDNNYLGSPVTHSVVESNSEYTWHFDVETNIKSEIVTISWDNTYFGDNDKHMVLVNRANGDIVNMREKTAYSFTNNEVNPFTIKFGGVEVLENTAIIVQNAFPNPFDHEVNIPIYLPDIFRNYEVSAQIYSSTGVLIREINTENKTPGNHIVTWNGANNQGQKVTNGIYLMKVTIRDEMVLIENVIKIIKK
ncbi:CARDB domain-containing protein [Bacteroidota bacterium]